MSSGIDLGVVGLGSMGRRHARNAEANGADVVAGSDVDGEAREAFGDDYDADTYENHEAMYDAETLDSVVITTPNAFHEPAATAALERDIDVLCEKPLAHSLSAAKSIVDTAADSNAFCMLGVHNRFSIAGELFRNHRDAGRFGEIRHVEANYVRRRGIPGVGSWFTDVDIAGGGALIDIGVHAIDFALHFVGFPEIKEVSGVTRADFGGREHYADPDGWANNWDVSDGKFDVEDSANAFIRCVDDTTITLDVAWAANRESKDEFVVRGTDAGAKCTLGGDSLSVYEAHTMGADHYADTTLEGTLDPSGHEAEMVAFLQGVESGEKPSMNTIEEGLAVQRVIDAVYRSSERGEAVRFDG